MKLHDLKSVLLIKRKRKKIVGRGTSSGHGKTSCRGHKGDGSRSGTKQRYGYEGGGVPLYRRVPTRGFSNKRFSTKVEAITTSRLCSLFSEGDAITLEVLKSKKIVKSNTKFVKIILKGDLDKKFQWLDSSVLLSQGVLSRVQAN